MFFSNILSRGFKKWEEPKTFLRIENIFDKNDILTAQYKLVTLIGNIIKRSPEMTTWQRNLEAIRLKVAKMRVKKQSIN